MFYQLGKLQTWELTCELFEYSNERFNTGIPEIDILQTKFDTNSLDWAITDEQNNMLKDEDGNLLVLESSTTGDLIPGDDGDEIQRESDLFVDFSKKDPFSEGNI